MFRCNLPPALLAEWPGSFTCHCGNKGCNGHRIRVSTQSCVKRRKFTHHFCQDSNSQLFHHESGALTNKLYVITILRPEWMCAYKAPIKQASLDLQLSIDPHSHPHPPPGVICHHVGLKGCSVGLNFRCLPSGNRLF